MNSLKCEKALSLAEFKSLLESEIQNATTDLKTIKSKKVYQKCDRDKISKLEKLIKANKLIIPQIDAIAQLKIGDWVKFAKSKSKDLGQIQQITIKDRVPVVEVQWWRDRLKFERICNLEKIPFDLIDWNWDGSDNPKLIRHFDSFECDDTAVLANYIQEIENSILRAKKVGQPDKTIETRQKKLTYCKKRIDHLQGKIPKTITPKQHEQLNIYQILDKKPQHTLEQIEALTCFGSRKKETEIIDLDLIRKDGGTQQRVKLNLKVVAKYAKAMKSGDKFPPIKVIFDGVDYWLYDGFHTLEAASINKQSQIEVYITDGTKRDAILQSVSVNFNHGLRRTHKDKRKAVTTLLQDEEWSKWSNCEIARHCKVTEGLVRKIKKDSTLGHFVQYEVRNVDNNSVTGEFPSETKKTYKDKHGNIKTMDTSNIGKSDNTSGKNSGGLQQLDVDTHPLIEFLPNTLVQLKLADLSSADEHLKSLNHGYCKILSKTDIGKAYKVKFYRVPSGINSLQIIMAHELVAVKEISVTTTCGAEEFIELMESPKKLANYNKKAILEAYG